MLIKGGIMKMQIILDSDTISGLFPILTKPNKSFRFSQMQINIKNNVLQMVALNDCIIGIYERPLGDGEYSKDCSFVVPLQNFGKAQFFKEHKVFFIGTDDYNHFKFWTNGFTTNFETETFVFPKWEHLLLTDGEKLSSYLVFNPKFLQIAEKFLGDGYYKAPMTKKYHNQVQWDFVENDIKKTVVLMPIVIC